MNPHTPIAIPYTLNHTNTKNKSNNSTLHNNFPKGFNSTDARMRDRRSLTDQKQNLLTYLKNNKSF